MSNKELTRKVMDIEEGWREVVNEAKRRDEELASGAVEGRSHEQVMEAARPLSPGSTQE